MSAIASVEEKTVRPEGVAEDLREQAEAAGYRVAQQLPAAFQMYQCEDPNRPWHIQALAGKTPFTYGCVNDFWFGTFATKEEAETEGLSDILHIHGRAEQLEENYFIRQEDNKLWRVGRATKFVAGPFDNPTAALDEAERLARQSVEDRKRMAAHKQARQLELCRIPAAFCEITLDSFKAKTAALADALQKSREYVRTFAPPGPLSRSLWFCGNTGSGKTVTSRRLRRPTRMNGSCV